MLESVFSNLQAFATYFAAAAAILAIFLTLYTVVTPYNELVLIRQGNTAAAVSLGGALLGMALPVAVAVAVSHNLVSMAAWGVIACLIQLLAFVVARLAMPQLAHDIPADKLSVGIFLASLSIGVGIVNAACII